MRRERALRWVFGVVLWGVLVLDSETRAQGVVINGLVAHGARANLNITVDLIEYRQGDDAMVHLTTGKKHYGLAVVSPRPLPQFDPELLLSTTAQPFTVSVEDGREFTGCLVTGLKTVGPDTAPRLSYALACESMSLPPLKCTNGRQRAHEGE